MKKVSVLLFVVLTFPIFTIGGIIIPKEGDNIEDVTNISVTGTEVKYFVNGQEQSMSAKKVAAVMYDDGRYEEVKEVPQNTYLYTESQSSYNVQSQQGYFNQTSTQEGYNGSLKQAKDIRTAGIVFTAVGALPIGLPMLLVGIHRVDNY
ncbi:MAG: hypothetical protein MJZ64_06005 [Paludibacteraceae bacterium]|nr:hypothetical protein [Paludibacteraceae bacterium]